jgi:hypothetical protein
MLRGTADQITASIRHGKRVTVCFQRIRNKEVFSRLPFFIKTTTDWIARASKPPGSIIVVAEGSMTNTARLGMYGTVHALNG